MNFRQTRKKDVEISLTPMIDVVFLLLIFFMVTTTFNRDTELQIKLPEAEGNKRNTPDIIELSIDADGIYFVNNHQLVNQKLSTLKAALLKVSGEKQRLPLIISADGRTPHQAVISALDVAQQSGFVRLSFATNAPSEE